MKKTLIISIISILGMCNATAQIKYLQLQKALNQSDQIRCRNMALTQYYGTVALSQDVFIPDAIPADINNLLYNEFCRTDIDEQGESHIIITVHIEDIHITESGKWIVVYNQNQYKANFTLNYELESALKTIQNRGLTIHDITFNEEGDWVVMYDTYNGGFFVGSNDTNDDDPGYYASESMMPFIQKGERQYGKLYAINIYENDSKVGVFNNELSFVGRIPKRLIEDFNALKEKYEIRYITVAGPYYFISDGYVVCKFNIYDTYDK